jgi:hypothetical protein
MKPLIDADILRYEIGFASETGWRAIKEWKEGDPALDPPPFDYVAELLDNRISEICAVVNATEPPTLFLTGKGNFREGIAQKKQYKGNRLNLVKPFHYNNISVYLKGKYDVVVTDGIEADDLLCIEQTKRLVSKDTIICSRDKDLRQCPGWHFGWELGNQPQFGPEWVDEIGYLSLSENKKKLKGVGAKYFYAQLLMGDATDNIPGLPSTGPVAAFKMLDLCATIPDCEKAVVEAYKRVYEGSWKTELLEQAMLVWMVRSFDEEDKPIMFKLMEEYE